jgi:hypothetical protein
MSFEKVIMWKCHWLSDKGVFDGVKGLIHEMTDDCQHYRATQQCKYAMAKAHT